MIKTMMVKEVEVEVTETHLIFEKDGETVELERKVGRDDYRLVYQYLSRKGSARPSNGLRSVGQFEYDLQEDVVSIRRIGEEEWLVENLELEETQIKNIRNTVINWIINNL